MLDEWCRFLTRAVGSTLATLRQLAHEDNSAACRLGWFIEKRTQQYLVLCAGVEHEDDINLNLLDFRSTRQQLEDGAFVFRLRLLERQDGVRGSAAAKAEAPAHQEEAAHDLDERDNQQTLSRTRSRTCSRRTPTTSGRSSSITCGAGRSRTCAAAGT
ncbi:hypothetical protein MHU86_23712 [Fragilaria crotonensis]|nr:hypothetical protein MHU86_23712 [Fragilaria crotonensis]